MKQYIYNEQNGLWYELWGDYYIPCLVLPAEKEERHIGVWGHWHLQYLKENRKVLYTDLLTSSKLNSYLADIDLQASERLERLTEQMKQAEGITEQLKAENAMEWVQKMNNIRHRAEEIICSEIIYA